MAGPLPDGITLADGVLSGTTLEPGYYKFLVRVSNAAGSDEQTVEWTVELPTPAAPGAFTAPASVTADDTPTFTWPAVDDAVTYDLQVDDNSDFSSPIIDETGIATNSYTPGDALSEWTTLYARARGVNAAGVAGAWSSTLTFTVKTYDWIDEFTDVTAAGSVNGTLSSDGNSTRTVVDTQNKLSINGAAAVFAPKSPTPGYSDPAMWYSDDARVVGKMLVASVVVASGHTCLVGFDFGQAGLPVYAILLAASGNISAYSPGAICGKYSLNTQYNLTLALRTLGADLFIQGGTEYPETTLLWRWLTGNNTPVNATINNNAANLQVLYMAVPTQRALFAPLASDGFGGVWGTTDGLGHAEASGLGSGGNGLAWTTQAGTYGITSSKAQASALAGGLAIATVDTGDADVILDTTITRAGGIAGVVLRYVDADNYIYAGHDGTNAVLVERVAGDETTLITAAVAIGAGGLRVILDGTAAELYLDTNRVGTGATLASAGTSGKHGLYTTDVGNTNDAFVVFARR